MQLDMGYESCRQVESSIDLAVRRLVIEFGQKMSVVVTTAADGAAHRAEQQQHETDNRDDDANGP